MVQESLFETDSKKTRYLNKTRSRYICPRCRQEVGPMSIVCPHCGHGLLAYTMKEMESGER